METSALRQLLKSFCNRSHWKYAVFWGLRHHSPMFLTWEDGYFAYSKPTEPVGSTSDDISLNKATDISSLQCEIDGSNGNYGYPVELAVANMSCLQYAFGEGVVGEVAYTGNHCWIYSDDVFGSRFNSKIIPGCPDEWLLQFVAGIKTVLLVPVIPDGVLQLGSLEKVAESVAVVSYIKDSFSGLQNDEEFSVPFISNWNSQLPWAFGEVSEAVDSVKSKNNKLFSANQAVPLFKVQDALQVLAEDIPLIHESESKKEINVFSVGLNEGSSLKGQCINDSQWEVMESDPSRFYCLEEELHAVPQCSNYNLEMLEKFSEEIANSYYGGDLTESSLGANDACHSGTGSFLSFPTDCELHKALGLAMRRQTSDYIQGSPEDASNAARSICNWDLIDIMEPWNEESSGHLLRGGNEVNLLEDVVANVPNGSDDTSSQRSNSIKSSTSMSGQFSTPTHASNQSKGSSLVRHDSPLWSHVKPEIVASRENAFTNSSISSSFESTLTTVVDEEQRQKGYGCLQPRKGSKLSSVNKKRGRAGNDQRPRPRDRQMIQDRVKELRELVPNGAKCSIDGLLDRTIKHMSFLRNTTDRAAKLKQRVRQELSGRRSWRSSQNKAGHQNGTSWAFELGSELTVCPIVVEDLDCPGHILIEMMCNEHGLFLEIAQVIRGLELTILKGVMESRSNNTWAHFIVEVSRGFHRMDIFWPLMQLWQQNQNVASSKN